MANSIVKIIIFLFIALLASCDSYELFDLLSSSGDGTPVEGGALSIVPVYTELVVGTVFTFTATGGTPPYIFSLVSGLGSINPESGVYTAPADASVDIVQVTDDEGSQSQVRVVVGY